MPKNLLILKFLYGRDRPRGLFASKELPSQDAEMAWQNTSSFPLCPGHRPGPTLLKNSFSRNSQK